jgi:hypothetical protein
MIRAFLARLGLVENMARQALSRSGSGDTLATKLQYTFVFRPGAVGPLAPNVYATWPTLMAAIALVQGPKLVEIDTRFGAAVVSPGAWTLDDITWTSFTGVDVLTWPTGTTATGVVDWSLENGVELLSTSTAPIVTTSPAVNGGFLNLAISDFGFIGSLAGAAPFFSIPAGTELDGVLDTSGQLGDSTHAVITLAGTVNLSIVGGAALRPNATTGAGTFNVSVGADGIYQTPQAAATVQFPFPAQQVIAHTNPALIVAGATIQDVATTDISKVRSGFVDVDVQASFTPVGAGAGTVTMRLFRDTAATPIGPIFTVTNPANTFPGNISWRDTLPDDAPHTYGWTATASAGTLAVDIGNSGISAHEIP